MPVLPCCNNVCPCCNTVRHGAWAPCLPPVLINSPSPASDHQADGHSYVVKKVKLARQSPKERSATLVELQILSNIKHRNVLRYKEAWVESGCVSCMVVEMCECGDLLTQLRSRLPTAQHFHEAHLQDMLVQVRRDLTHSLAHSLTHTHPPTHSLTRPAPSLSLTARLRCTVQLASGLSYLHQNQIVHRDIKSSNIFITGDGCLKIADFGLASILDPDSPLSAERVGTPGYMAPEIMKEHSSGYEVSTPLMGRACCKAAFIRDSHTLSHSQTQHTLSCNLGAGSPRVWTSGPSAV